MDSNIFLALHCCYCEHISVASNVCIVGAAAAAVVVVVFVDIVDINFAAETVLSFASNIFVVIAIGAVVLYLFLYCQQ